MSISNIFHVVVIIVSTFAFPLPVAFAFATSNFLTSRRTAFVTRARVDMCSTEDPYTYLEEVSSETSLAFAKEANLRCLSSLGDPTNSSNYSKILSVLESDQRIAYVSKYGLNEDGNFNLINLWKDSKNPKGLWRRTTLDSYRSNNTEWKTILSIDQLAEQDAISWVWKGSRALPRALDICSQDGKRTTRTLLSLSKGGADATVLKEFDMLKEDFVNKEEQGFELPEAKTSASWKSRDVLIVGSDFGDGSLTNSGYPRVIKEWVRGTKIEDAPIVFEGEKTDVSVSAYVNDQRKRNGPIYEIRKRSLTFYTSKYWVRRVKYEHLLAPNDPIRKTCENEFVQLDVQEDAGVSFLSSWVFLTLKSDWTPIEDGVTYTTGSLIYVNANSFLSVRRRDCKFYVLFEPSTTLALRGYSVTKNYVILSVMENVKPKLLFYKFDGKGSPLQFCGGDRDSEILERGCGPIDSTDSDKFWYYTSGYTQPSALSLADASNVIGKSGSNNYVIEKLKSLPHMYDSTNIIVSQRFAKSSDGTNVPYFIISNKDTLFDGDTPTLLYGYGGFEVSLQPRYIASVGLSWLERGGVYVEANIRGGGEFGPKWHQAGLKANRFKVYDDFTAVAEDLISRCVCKPSTLAARGGSNGGLLMGMMYTTRPELFGAIHCAVPLLDMKRFHILLAGASWMAEYGDPDTDDWKNFLCRYSPYHLIDESREKYPPMLITTSTRDDRVHPAHARKMVKKLWDLRKDNDWPVYYYENIEGGHGGAADAKQQAFMTALAYDFMWNTLSKGKTNFKDHA